LAYPNGFGLSQKRDTQYFFETLDYSTGRLLHYFPEGYSIQIVQRRHITEDSYGIDCRKRLQADLGGCLTL